MLLRSARSSDVGRGQSSRYAGLLWLAALWSGSFLFSVIWPSPVVDHCPLGRDLVRPDHPVCELIVGGLWISLCLGIAAGAFSTLLGLGAATLARSGGRFWDWATMRFADAFFSLPDVLVLMVFQFAVQTLGDLQPRMKLRPLPAMILSLSLVGWAAPARMLRNRLQSLEVADFVAAAKALGAGRWQLFRAHLWPNLREYTLSIFLARIPNAIVAESTVSFLGIGRMEPMSLGRYLGESYASLMYASGARIVLPAWMLLVLAVLGAILASRAFTSSANA